MDLAAQLWGDKEVTQFICAAGKFSYQDIINRLDIEFHNDEVFHIQYWPIFELATDELIGCCGIRPFKTDTNSYEFGSHLRKKILGHGICL